MGEVTWNGREVTNPVLRGFSYACAWTAVASVLATLMVTWPLWLSLDFVLRRIGKRGFVVFAGDGRHFSLSFTGDAFRKVGAT